MLLDLKSRQFDRVIVLIFIGSFFLFLFSQKVLGLLLLGLGLYLIHRQEKVLTSQKADPKVSYAGFWVRAGSLGVDGGVFGLWTFFLYLVLREKLWDYFNYFFYLFAYSLVMLYMVKRWGQTPGKMLMGIKVVRIDLKDLTWKEALLRSFIDLLDDLWDLLKAVLIYSGVITTGLFLVGSASPHEFPSNFFKILYDKKVAFSVSWASSEPLILLINHKKRAFHDYLAGTVVIVKEKVGFRSWLWAVFFIVAGIGYMFFVFNNMSMTRTLANKGEPLYECKLGKDYYSGKVNGIPQDYSLALQWFQKAADQDYPQAQFYLGEMYEKGCGVTADKAKAIEWYSLAEKNGDLRAKNALKKLGVKLEK